MYDNIVNVQQLQNLLTFALVKDREENWHENWASIIEYILFKSRTPLSSNAILHELERMFSVSVLRKHQLKDFIELLLSAQRVERAGKNQLQLTEARRTEVASRINHHEQVLIEFRKHILQRIEELGRTPDPTVRSGLNRAVNRFVSVFLSSQSIASLCQLSKGVADEHLSAMSMHIKSSAEVFDEPLVKKFYIQAMLDSVGTQKFAAFFWRALQNFICLEIMRLDPALEEFRRHFLDSPLVYVDSNVVINLLLSAEGTSHELAKLACSEMQRLSIVPRVTSITLEEVGGVFRGARELMLKGTPTEADLSNPFIYDYVQCNKETPQSWTQYALRFISPDVLMEKLQNDFNIHLEEVDTRKLLTDGYYKEMAKTVRDCWGRLRDNEKTEEAVEHDAMMLIQVASSRRSENGKHIAWFLTLDLSLGFLSRALQIHDKDKPLAVMLDAWVQTLSLFPGDGHSTAGSLDKVLLDAIVARWSRALPALGQKETQQMLDTLDDTPTDLYHLMEIAEILVKEDWIVRPTVARLREQVKDYDGSMAGIRGYLLRQADARIMKTIEECTLPIPMRTSWRIALTAGLFIGTAAASYLTFTLGVNRIFHPLVFIYPALLTSTLLLTNAVWGTATSRRLLSLWRKLRSL